MNDAPARIEVDWEPERRIRPRRIPIFFALLFYGFPTGVALAWMHHQSPGRLADWLVHAPVAPALAWGVAVGLAMASGAGLLAKYVPRARDLEEEFAFVCADHRAWEIALLALMSGFAEELFFRGALAGQFGALMATLAFAIFHWPINERYALWPVFALVAGAVFQVLMQRTGSLWAPIAAHVVVNAVNLARIRIKYGHLR